MAEGPMLTGPCQAASRGLHPKKDTDDATFGAALVYGTARCRPADKAAGTMHSQSTRSKSSLNYYAYAHYSITAMDKTIKFLTRALCAATPSVAESRDTKYYMVRASEVESTMCPMDTLFYIPRSR